MFFGKKVRPLPISEAQTMLSSGTPDSVVRERLKQEGYTEAEISKSVDQARIKIGVTSKEAVPDASAPWESAAPSAERPPWESPLQAPPAQEVQAQAPPAQLEQAPPAQEAQNDQYAQMHPEPQQTPWQVPESETQNPVGYGQPDQPPEVQVPEQAPEEPAQQYPEPSFAQEDVQVAIDSAISGLKTELDAKFMELESKLESVEHLEENLGRIVSDLDEIKGKYTAMSERAEKLSEMEDEMLEVKGNVSSVLQILKSTLPPVIKSLKDLKEKKV